MMWRTVLLAAMAFALTPAAAFAKAPAYQPYHIAYRDGPVTDVFLNGLKMQMDKRVWPKQYPVVSDAPVFEFFDIGEKAGAIIGQGLLKDNSLAIDFAGRRLYIGPMVYR